MEQMATKCPRSRAVIVGAGFGGLAAAKRLAKAPSTSQSSTSGTTIFSTLLYQVATAALSPADVASLVSS